MKKLVLLILLLSNAAMCLADSASYGHLAFDAQSSYSGKYFVATIMKGKGFPCSRVRYCVLKFSKDSVAVSYPTRAYCNTVKLSLENSSDNETLTKNYKWTVVNGILIIPEFKEYTKYKFEEKDQNYVNGLSPKAISDGNTRSDTFTYYKYIGGKPAKSILDIEQKVARQWGIQMDYTTGDCTAKYDYKAQECALKNEKVFEYLTTNFGKNWKVVFDQEVADQVKALANKRILEGN